MKCQAVFLVKGVILARWSILARCNKDDGHKGDHIGSGKHDGKHFVIRWR